LPSRPAGASSTATSASRCGSQTRRPERPLPSDARPAPDPPPQTPTPLWKPLGSPLVGLRRLAAPTPAARPRPRSATPAGPMAGMSRRGQRGSFPAVALCGGRARHFACDRPKNQVARRLPDGCQAVARQLPTPDGRVATPLHHHAGEHVESLLVCQRRRSAPSRFPDALRRERQDAFARAGRPDRSLDRRIRLRRSDPD
jgi:hypothetical protein